MQPVQTWSRLGVPFTVARTRWMLGSKRRLVIFRDHGRLLPKPGFLAQMSQTAAIRGLLGDVETFGGARSAGNRTRISEPRARTQFRARRWSGDPGHRSRH